MKICLATSELLGAPGAAGIGAAVSSLALFLAGAGHTVTVLLDATVVTNAPSAQAYKAANVEIICAEPSRLAAMPVAARDAIATYDALGQRDFDVILFQDWLGLAFCCIAAKRAGLCFQTTVLAVNVHGGLQWCQETVGELPEGRYELVQMFLERRAVELADAVVCPTHYIRGWMAEARWRLPADTLTIANHLGLAQVAAARPPMALGRSEASPGIREVAFFGRFEARKGLPLFLESLLEPPLREVGFPLTFLGMENTFTGADLLAWVERNRPDLRGSCKAITTFASAQAQSYLVESGALAVMPSRADNLPCTVWECIEAGIDFVSTAVGGIPELVDPADHERVLMEASPAALARAIRRRLDAPGSDATPIRHRSSQAEVGARWLAWLDGLPKPSASGAEEASHSVEVSIDAVVVTTDGGAIRGVLQDLFLQTRLPSSVTLALKRPPGIPRSFIATRLAVRCSFEPLESVFAALASDYVLLLDAKGSLSPDAIMILVTAARTSGADVVVATTIESGGDFLDAGSRKGATEILPLGGPCEVGLVDNVFGHCPMLARRGVISGEQASRVGEDGSVWPLLMALTAAGHSVLGVPLALSARPPSGAQEARARRVAQTAYAGFLPDRLKHLSVVAND